MPCASWRARVRPKLITLGGSLNLFEHPVAEVRAIADAVGATLMFDAAHQSGVIAGKVWQQPLEQGAQVMTMSTYKSLGGPPGGLIVSNDAAMMERIDAIAYPGLTANFDAGKVAALALGLLDWKAHGPAYAQAMQRTALALAQALDAAGLPVFGKARMVLPVRTSWPWKPPASVAGRLPPNGYGAQTCWPAASACRSPTCRATTTACAWVCPRSCAWAWTRPTCRRWPR